MKQRITLFLFVVLSVFQFSANASHVAGGNITYRYVGNNKFKVRLTLFRDCSGINLGTTDNVQAKTSCGTTLAAIPVTLLPGSGAEIPTECSTDEGPTTCEGGTRYGIERYDYEGVWTVPATLGPNCKTITFSWSTCCRNGSQTLQAATGASIYLETTLNLTAAPDNNSVRFATFNVPSYCILDSIHIVQNGIEPDGDSVVYKLDTARSSATATLPYNTAQGYSPNSPILTIGSILIAGNGNLAFLSQPQDQTVVVVIKVYEYRAGVLISTMIQDVQILLKSNGGPCNKIVPRVVNRYTKTANCNDSTFKMQFFPLIECSSFEPTGSEIRLIDPQGNLMPVLKHTPDTCNTDNRTTTSVIKLVRPFELNGVYKGRIKKGLDNDTFGNKCQEYMPDTATFWITVSNCYKFEGKMEMVNVTVDTTDDKSLKVSWAPPLNFDVNKYVSTTLYRKQNPWDGYTPIATLTDYNNRFYHDMDTSLDVSKNRYFYAVNLRYKTHPSLTLSYETPISDSLSNYVLGATSPTNTGALTLDIEWIPYLGWTSPVYNLEYVSLDTMRWDSIVGNLTDGPSTYTYTKPTVNGSYKLRLYTENAPNRSYSNTIRFEVPPREFKFGNVITPNNDGKNDTWEFENAEYYPFTSVEVYDRWGRKVYASTDYKGDWGKDADPGAYFYTITLQKDNRQFKGMLQVLK